MIRRRVGDQFFLFTQHDHAVLSGQLAVHYGNSRFMPARPIHQTIEAISLHDCGWSLHDDSPTLNDEHLPLDVFETPLELATKVWQASVDRLAGREAYVQLLVSLHVLGLSGFAATHAHSRAEMFELNRFQQREIERQEGLRKQLGLSTNIPLRLGLALDNKIEEEGTLRCNYNILQAMDRISLVLCCTEVPFARVEHLCGRPGGATLAIELRRTSATSICVEPWPFGVRAISLDLPYRALSATMFSNVDEFRRAYGEAPVRHLAVNVHC